MASPDACAFCTGSFAFFSFFSFFLLFLVTSCQSPSWFGAWLLATLMGAEHSTHISVASFTLSVPWQGLFLSIPCWMMLRALANLSIFTFYSFRSWRTSFNPSAPEEAPKSTFPAIISFESINCFTSASCVEKRVGIVENRSTLGPKSHPPSSLRPNLRLAGPEMYGQTGLPGSNTGSDTCVQYALPDQGPEGAGSWSRMTCRLGRARLTLTLPPRGPGKTPLGDEALPVGCHTEPPFGLFLVIGHRLQRLCSVPQEIPYTNRLFASLKKEPVRRVFSHIQRTYITVMWRRHSFSSLISRRHSQTHSQRGCLGYTSFFMHGDESV